MKIRYSIYLIYSKYLLKKFIWMLYSKKKKKKILDIEISKRRERINKIKVFNEPPKVYQALMMILSIVVGSM